MPLTKTGALIAKTGLYVSVPRKFKLDRRSRFGKAVGQLRTALAADLGGEPSTQQTLLIDRAIFKVIRLSSFEADYLYAETKPENESMMNYYLAMSNSLRHDLMALGLERKAAQIETLGAYVAKNYPAKSKDGQEGEDEKA